MLNMVKKSINQCSVIWNWQARRYSG